MLSGIETANAEHVHSGRCSEGIIHHHTGKPIVKGGCYNGNLISSTRCTGTMWHNGVTSSCGCGGLAGGVKCNACGYTVTVCGGCGDDDPTGRQCEEVIREYAVSCGLEEGRYYSLEDTHSKCSHCTTSALSVSSYYTSTVCPKCNRYVSGKVAELSCTAGGTRHYVRYVQNISAHTGCSFVYDLGTEIDTSKITCKYNCNLKYGGKYYIVTKEDMGTAEYKCAVVVDSIRPRR